jgi:hypothetical protein
MRIRAKRFDYDSLPLAEVAERYRKGTSWRELARVYGCPDHKTLAAKVKELFPDLAVRNHAEAQRARREREGAKARRNAAEKANSRVNWWR